MSATVDRHAAMLARDGWCVFGRAVEPVLIAGIEADLDPRFTATPLCQGAFYGARTKRFGSLLTRSSAIERLAMHPLILEIVEQMLLPWCERIALNLTQAIEIHPGALPQLPHRDQDMWQGPKGGLEYLVNVMWPLTTFTRMNGGTRLWTGSQFDQDIPVLPEDEAVVPTVAPGDALSPASTSSGRQMKSASTSLIRSPASATASWPAFAAISIVVQPGHSPIPKVARPAMAVWARGKVPPIVRRPRRRGAGGHHRARRSGRGP